MVNLIYMSRSKKKPYITDQNRSKPGYGTAKRKANKAVRLRGKLALKSSKQIIANGKAYRKVSCSWGIRDWAFYEPKNVRAKRK